MSKVLVQGVGVNDAGYSVHSRVGGISQMCPFYRSWTGMLTRGYSQNFKVKRPTYTSVDVAEEWHLFSNFRSWMEKQPWEGMVLDKDLKILGNNTYSPQTCTFIPNKINTLLGTCSAVRGSFPIGVSRFKVAPDMVNFLKNSYLAEVQTLEGKRLRLGSFPTSGAAHRAWQQAKIGVIYDYINWWQFDYCVNHTFNQDIAQSLIRIIQNIQEDIHENRETRVYF